MPRGFPIDAMTEPGHTQVYRKGFFCHVPSLNEVNRLRNASRWNYTRRGRALAGISLKAMRENWAELFRTEGAPLPKRTIGKRYVVFTRIMCKGQRRYDDDNLAGGLKSARDALADVGLIAHDGPSGAHFDYRQEPGNGSGLLVEIYECNCNL